MNPQIITLDPATTPISAKTILAKDGFQCSLITLAPGDETPLRESHDVEEHILFVIDGEATVRFGDVNTIVSRDQALLIPKGKTHLIAAGAKGWAKLLRVDVPPRQIITPQILTLDR
jgi:mannose-6-phosphate isomerase-like protein (cupin superfamily)